MESLVTVVLMTVVLVEEREGEGGAGRVSDHNRIPEKAQWPQPPPPPHHGESSSQSRLRGDFHSKDPACVRPLITAHHGLGIAWGQQEARLNEGSW